MSYYALDFKDYINREYAAGKLTSWQKQWFMFYADQMELFEEEVFKKTQEAQEWAHTAAVIKNLAEDLYQEVERDDKTFKELYNKGIITEYDPVLGTYNVVDRYKKRFEEISIKVE